MSRFIQTYYGSKLFEDYYQYRDHPSLPFERALAPVSAYIDQLDDFINFAKSKCHNFSAHKLTEDESAAIYLYTIERNRQSVHHVLNQALYLRTYPLIRPWFGFLKLFNTALEKLSTIKATIWRAVNANIAQNLRDNDEIIWANFSSCSFSSTVIRNLLDDSSILCSIEAINGKRIRDFASDTTQDEVLLLPGTRLRVKAKNFDRSTNKYVLYLEEIRDENSKTSTSTPTSVSTASKSSSDTTNNPTRSYVSTANVIMKTDALHIDESMRSIDGSVTTFSNGDRYEITYKNGKKEGYSKLYEKNGKVHEGNLAKNRANGDGTRICSNGDRYEGKFSWGQMCEYGIYRRADGYVYDGNWIADEPHGDGCTSWPNANRYEGMHQRGKIQGYGTFFSSKKNEYKGNLVDGKAHGEGIRTWPNGDRYRGDFRHDKKHGSGTYLYANGSKYEGSWDNDEIHGKGVLEWSSGSCYDGTFKNGKRHGWGKLTFSSGQVQEGRWENDKYVGKTHP